MEHTEIAETRKRELFFTKFSLYSLCVLRALGSESSENLSDGVRRLSGLPWACTRGLTSQREPQVEDPRSRGGVDRR